MNLTKDERKLVAALLRLASDEYSNHGCNDFDLRDHGLEHMAEELNELEWPDEEDRPVSISPVVSDWLMMSRLADKLEEEEQATDYIETAKIGCTDIGQKTAYDVEVNDDANTAKYDGGYWVQCWMRIPEEFL
jgi:hypothetical protein